MVTPQSSNGYPTSDYPTISAFTKPLEEAECCELGSRSYLDNSIVAAASRKK